MVGKRLTGLLGALALAVSAVACSESDPGITTAVKAKLAADDVVKSYRIDVDTRDRVVTLSGAVDTPAAKERAVQLARATEGVSNVVDNLNVSPGVTPTTGIDDPAQREAKEAAGKTGDVLDKTGAVITDAAVTSAVKSKFLADARVSGLKIDVDTKDGIVTLTGTVATEAEKQSATTLARDTSGVKRVVNNLKVGR